MTYQPPIQDMVFTIRELAGWTDLQRWPAFAAIGDETLEAVLTEAARLTVEVVAPLNRVGDQQPSVLRDGVVDTPPGFKEAFQTFVAAGWQGVQHPERLGGQGLPKLVATACAEMLNSANLAFALCPLLTDSAIEALLTAGSPAQQAQWVPPLIRGDWTGTMNLTEPDAGSDLSRIRTLAEPQPDGSYRVMGQKIYITYGEHEWAQNILHMVLARTPQAPAGVKGLSLFIVPKWLVDDQGQPTARNDVHGASLEHKLGIKASPTVVMLYGAGVHPVAHGVETAPRAGAVGWRMGEEGRGLEYMFIMMNAARFAVAVQGLAVAEHAYQKARDYARDRMQGRALDGGAETVPIIRHPDVRRMLMTMRALTEGTRQLAYVGAAACDTGHAASTANEREAALNFYDFLVPVLKGFATEISLEVTSLGLQVHGGMGFIEDSGAAQLYRDARILTIYEGTTAIQANDLLGRKTLRDGGARARALVQQMAATLADLPPHEPALADLAAGMHVGLARLGAVIDTLVAQAQGNARAAYAGSVPYLMMFGTLLVGWQWVRAAQRAAALRRTGHGDPAFLTAKIVTAQFYVAHIVPRTALYHEAITAGSDSVLALDEAQF